MIEFCASGAPMGPALLLQRQRREIPLAELQRKWKRTEEPATDDIVKSNWPWSMQLPCRRCSYIEGADVWKPLSLFCARYHKPTRTDLWKKYLSLGETLQCQCSLSEQVK